MKRKRCDYCNKKATNVIYACRDHVKALDRTTNRRTDHSVNEVLTELQKRDNTIQKLLARIKELTKEQKET